MNPSRPSSFGISQEFDKTLSAAQSLSSRLAEADLQLLKNVTEFKSWKLDTDETEENGVQDPAIIESNVSAQTVQF